MSKLAKILKARASAWAAQRAEEEIARSDLHDDLFDSGIRHSPDLSAPKSEPSNDVHAVSPADQNVTLVVYGWHNVQPGPMSWAFPSVRQAISAAKAMRNAISWAIVLGQRPATALEEARKLGIVLLEHAG